MSLNCFTIMIVQIVGFKLDSTDDLVAYDAYGNCYFIGNAMEDYSHHYEHLPCIAITRENHPDELAYMFTTLPDFNKWCALEAVIENYNKRDISLMF